MLKEEGANHNKEKEGHPMTGQRFAFYGRVTTEDQQDPTSSKQWQTARAEPRSSPHGGVIVAEFFDIGQSRSLPWKRRPEAAALLEALKRPDRGFDAVVIGEPARAFYGDQFGAHLPRVRRTTASSCGCQRSAARSTPGPTLTSW